MTDAPVYLDYAATTPIDDRVLEAHEYLCEIDLDRFSGQTFRQSVSNAVSNLLSSDSPARIP